MNWTLIWFICFRKGDFLNMMDEQLSIQIYYNGDYHWPCSTYDFKNRQVLLFDSLYNNKTTMKLDTQLALLYGTESIQIDVIVPRIQRQNGMFDCGLFALATQRVLLQELIQYRKHGIKTK